MPKLIKIAETKDMTPGQAAAFDLESQESPSSMSNLFCHWRQLHARWRTAVGRRRSRHQGHLRLARRGFRSENGRRLGAAGRRRAFQVTKSWSKADIKVEV